MFFVCGTDSLVLNNHVKAGNGHFCAEVLLNPTSLTSYLFQLSSSPTAVLVWGNGVPPLSWKAIIIKSTCFRFHFVDFKTTKHKSTEFLWWPTDVSHDPKCVYRRWGPRDKHFWKIASQKALFRGLNILGGCRGALNLVRFSYSSFAWVPQYLGALDVHLGHDPGFA